MTASDRQDPKPTDYFSGLAAVYDEHRPSYPAAALQWVLEGFSPPVRVADIGCGTGISARLLAQHGATVIGIEPNADMLREARASSHDDPRLEYRAATADRTGLSQASLDVVVCAQSFHWFDAAAAVREFHRILRPGGRLSLIWNIKSERQPFSAQFTRIMRAAQVDAEARGLRVPCERQADATLGGYFANPRRREFENPQSLSVQGVLGRARSASYFPRTGPLRDALERELIDAFNRYQRDGRVELLHITEVTIAERMNEKTPGRTGG